MTHTAAVRPDKVAIVYGDERWTFGRLETVSNQLARTLQDGCDPGDRVALLLPKGPQSVAAMLGVMKAGAVYVPIDLQTPPPRARLILDVAKPRVVMVARPGLALLEEVRETLAPEALLATIDPAVRPDSIDLAFDADAVARLEEDAPAVAIDADAPAHILFTSGSTGVPKGVVITHANVSHFIEWAVDFFGITDADRLAGHPPIHFDMSTFDIYATLATGATLFPVPPELNLLPSRLVEFMREHELTQWFSVPSPLTQIAAADAIGEEGLPALHRLIAAGDVLPTQTVMYWMERVPQLSVTNLYGPTEATIDSTYYVVPSRPTDPTTPIPIGRAIPGEEVLVLDTALEPAAVGDLGELFIGGEGVSPGYWNDPERTAAAFLPHPNGAEHGLLYRTGDLGRVDAEGIIHYAGRRDAQVKTRGHRVELGEIETSLADVEDLADYAIVGLPVGGFEGTAICCAYAVRDGRSPTVADLRSILAARVPRYMIPSRWRRLEELPKNVNGKTDRRVLQTMFADAEEERT